MQFMKVTMLAQINPHKTMAQLVNDRNLLRILILATFALAFCG
jgi:hypothetical protein